jgi:hypothetical protein
VLSQLRHGKWRCLLATSPGQLDHHAAAHRSGDVSTTRRLTVTEAALRPLSLSISTVYPLTVHGDHLARA